MKNQSYILKTTGEKIPVEPRNGNDFSLEELKTAIGGGYVETVPLSNGRMMIVDEDGRRKQLPLNVEASRLYAADIIVGDALVCDRRQIV
jgi:Domain of unknown function (DUF3846)